jgi:hypothetical protein
VIPFNVFRDAILNSAINREKLIPGLDLGAGEGGDQEGSALFATFQPTYLWINPPVFGSISLLHVIRD